MAAMVNELMELSRIESEQSGLQHAPLDLHPFIDALREEHYERTEKRKIAFDVRGSRLPAPASAAMKRSCARFSTIC